MKASTAIISLAGITGGIILLGKLASGTTSGIKRTIQIQCHWQTIPVWPAYIVCQKFVLPVGRQLKIVYRNTTCNDPYNHCFLRTRNETDNNNATTDVSLEMGEYLVVNTIGPYTAQKVIAFYLLNTEAIMTHEGGAYIIMEYS